MIIIPPTQKSCFFFFWGGGYIGFTPTSEGVSCVMFLLAKFEYLAIFLICLCLFLTWDLMSITSMGNHGAAGDISDRRHSSSTCFI